MQVISQCHLDNISRLKLYHYQLATASTSPLSTSQRTQVGLLAQEVQQVIPDAVMETVSQLVSYIVLCGICLCLYY